jgi:hypothetical protein
VVNTGAWGSAGWQTGGPLRTGACSVTRQGESATGTGCAKRRCRGQTARIRLAPYDT